MKLTSQPALESSPAWPIEPDDDLPVLFEDEEAEMGSANLHALANLLLFGCLPSLLSIRQPAYQVFSDLNCYYEAKGRRSDRTGSKPNFAADIMCVQPFVKLPADIRSYTIGTDGPAPTTVIEILSQETAFERDLKEKLELYRKLKIPEYILVDLTGTYLKEKILRKCLQKNGRWKDVRDDDGGLTSMLGFRLIIDDNDPLGLFVVDAATGKRWVRPLEGNERVIAAEARAEAAEEQILALKAELERLRRNPNQ